MTCDAAPLRDLLAARCRDMAPAEAKRTILTARNPDLALITDHDAELLIRALGLKEA